MNSTAVRADPFTDAQILYLWIPAAAVMADLTGRKELIYFDKFPAASRQFVIQHSKEHPVTIIQCRFPISESFIGHGTHIQILYTNICILLGYRS